MALLNIIDPKHHVTLDDYASVGALALAVQELRTHASTVVPRFEGRTIWMVNSTSVGGGVAEMLPGIVSLLRELGFAVEWAVIGSDDPEFFRFTKTIHNMIHGEGEPAIDDDDAELFEHVNERNAKELGARLGARDVLIVHDPQPIALGALLRRSARVQAIWRCHIGLDRRTPSTSAAWTFLRRWAETYDQAVFSAPEYIPDYLAGQAKVIHPGIDPLSHKNRELAIAKLVGILGNGGLVASPSPSRTPPFTDQARRLHADGTWGPVNEPHDLELLFRPIVLQVSRWDRLKGWVQLMDAFVQLRSGTGTQDGGSAIDALGRRTIETTRLVLAGPDPGSIADDPEGSDVIRELSARYLELPSAMQRDIAILALPMTSAKENALLVNALQRCATVIVQNSLREGFGLTVTEAMWKGVAVLGSAAAGIRQQIRDGLEGRLVARPDDPGEIARALRDVLADEHAREAFARAGQLRVQREFLVLTQLRRWLEIFATL